MEYDLNKCFQVTLENLTDFTGATVDETNLKQEITDQDLRDALLGTEDGGVEYDVVSPGESRPSRDLTASASLALMKSSSRRLLLFCCYTVPVEVTTRSRPTSIYPVHFTCTC